MATLAPRDYLIEEYTRTVCPACFAAGAKRSDDPDVFVDGMLVSRGGKIWMHRFCGVHGESESLYEEDAELWRSRNGWATPTLQITPDRCDNFAGFPDGYREGLPASHGQHTCILLLNVTEHCNYSCPACYASALPPGHEHVSQGPTQAEILNTVDTVIAREGGKLGVVMISGGEPTVRKDLTDILCELFSRNVTRVMLNTNGRRIVKDDKFVGFLAQHRDRIEVYLQFDGLRSSTYLALRGEDVLDEKLKALELLNSAGVYTTLVSTVCKGVNEDEVGAVLLHGLERPYCCGLAIQPMFGSGRTPVYDPYDRVTPTGVLQRLKEQTGGLVCGDDFIPLPCSHKDCCDISYLIKTSGEQWVSLPKLIGRDELKKWIHLVANTISFEGASDGVKSLISSGILQRVFSEQQKVSALQLAGDILRMCDCVPGLSDLVTGIWRKTQGEKMLQKMAQSTFRVTVKQFMDAHTLHEARIRQCCVHVGTFEEDPRRHSFCWRWLFSDAVDFPAARESKLRVVG